MTTDMTKLLDYGEDFVRHLLLERRQPELVPMYHLISPEQNAILGCPWSNENDKLMMVEAVKLKSREMGATMAVFMAEAWIARSPAGLTPEQAEQWQAEVGPPSQHPDRQEVVQIVVTDGAVVKTRVLMIKRGEAGGIVELDVEPGSGLEMMSGRLIDGIIAPSRLH